MRKIKGNNFCDEHLEDALKCVERVEELETKLKAKDNLLSQLGKKVEGLEKKNTELKSFIMDCGCCCNGSPEVFCMYCKILEKEG